MSAAIDRRRAIAQSVATALAWTTLGPSAWAQSAAGAARPAPAAAKAAKDWAEADRIRNALLAQGIVLKDSASGTTWEAAQ